MDFFSDPLTLTLSPYRGGEGRIKSFMFGLSYISSFSLLRKKDRMRIHKRNLFIESVQPEELDES